MKASEARAAAMEVRTNGVANQKKEIYNKINNAAKRGDLSVDYFSDLLKEVREELIEDGYKVEVQRGLQHGQEEITYTILW
jgi:hypothetical protein